MKNKIINFLKKYPITIFLAIIAINLFSIAGSLKEMQNWPTSEKYVQDTLLFILMELMSKLKVTR